MPDVQQEQEKFVTRRRNKLPLLGLVEKKDESDHLLADRSSKTFLQVDVKSCPQNGNADKDDLKEALDKANEELDKGDKLFQNVLVPAAKLSPSWRMLNIVCFPEISNQEQLKDLGVDEKSLSLLLKS